MNYLTEKGMGDMETHIKITVRTKNGRKYKSMKLSIDNKDFIRRLMKEPYDLDYLNFNTSRHRKVSIVGREIESVEIREV